MTWNTFAEVNDHVDEFIAIYTAKRIALQTYAENTHAQMLEFDCDMDSLRDLCLPPLPEGF